MTCDKVFNFDLKGKLDDLYVTFGLADEKTKADEVSVHFIDVEQGDSILIKTNNHNILIDGGEPSESDTLLRYLDKENVDIIDIMIATHPHADHIGGLVEVLRKKHVNSVMMPTLPDDLVPSSKIYRDFLKGIDSNGINVITPRVGETIVKNDAKFTIIAPNKNSEFSNINDYSITVRLDVLNRSFLFTGDIEKDAEKVILNNKMNIDVDVLKVPHHGSDSSSTEEFIKSVSPKYVIYSLGENNKYDHPSEEIVNRYFRSDAVQYRTDKNGTIVFITNGRDLTVRKEKG